MSESLPDHLVNEARKVQSNDSSLTLSPAPSPLKIPELLKKILDMLPVKDNVSAARVCQAWKEPALDRLWYKIDSLVPLLCLLGPMTQGPDGVWTFKYDIKDADWSRYAVYAPRIREVCLHDFEHKTRISTQCAKDISTYLPSHLSLPRPASITLFTAAPAAETLSVLLLISQSLRRLVLFQVALIFGNAAPGSLDLMEDTMEDVMKAAAKLDDPCLEELQLLCISGGTAFAEAFKACLKKHAPRITSLMVKFPFDAQVWASVFSLPTLQTLVIAPLKFYELGTPEETIPRIPALVESQPQLKNLELDLPLREEPSQSNSPYSRIIRDLMGLRNLETLILYISLPLSLTESEVQEMGASWPKMRILQFENKSNWTGILGHRIAPQSDLSLLPSFLRGLPCLEELRVPFMCDKPLGNARRRKRAQKR
ncbi:hypothetical protein M407DRAFT_26081 [Tulasnella calospora MUT 4182]|uniref:F-box domain-containing protein n=1 Tax=Tulasnella calospora MUT 4182 TaxID=1051891 RepID=A0A0C3KSW3_9AGAM|nr:hypothetical protein M407DRAFT_26081 [Tulasnella calospora MUT 4182]